ncbi:hypothetical protein ABID65_001116 [Bradyrhizobium sp. S3.9.2]
MLRLANVLATAVALGAAPPFLSLPTKAESAYPTPTRDGRERFQRTGTCPTGYIGKGAFCEALHQDTPQAFPVIPGRTCPSGTLRSGDACKAFR